MNRRDFFSVLLIQAAARGQTPAPPVRPSDFEAFLPLDARTADDPKKISEAASLAGLKVLHSTSLDYHGIVVVEAPKDEPAAQLVRHTFASMTPVPVREYNGVLSVASGYFYLQFDDKVPMDEARARILGAGFRIVSPVLEPRSFIVVARSRLPNQREAELATLRKLPDLLYVSPDDIPLPIPARPAYQPLRRR